MAHKESHTIEGLSHPDSRNKKSQSALLYLEMAVHELCEYPSPYKFSICVPLAYIFRLYLGLLKGQQVRKR